MRQLVRVCVIGDAGTGKSSLISTAAADTFDIRPPPVLPPVRLPREFSPDFVAILVTDTSSRPEDTAALDAAVMAADAVVICFDALRHATLDNIRSVWYPRVQALKPDVPVILACCKADLMEEGHETQEVAQIRERVEQAVQDLQHVEVCLNCSSKTLRMVTDIFHYALKAVLYPLHPLYDRIEKRLKMLCLRALKRIFLMCDTNQDGSLSDIELNTFQQICFNAPLTEEELQSVKQVVQAKLPNAVDEAGLTLEGFLFLHVLFIERGRLESTWAVLRKFGYSDDLRLRDEILDKIPWALPVDQVYELSDVAIEFLTHQFFRFGSDGLVTWTQLQDMFGTIPPPVWQGEAWSHLLVQGDIEGAHHLESFLLKWQYSMLQDPRSAVSHMLYMGFGGPSGSGAQALLSKCVRRRQDKRPEMSTKHDDLTLGRLRRTIHCLVFGPRGSGKSSLARSLAGAPQGHSLLRSSLGSGARGGLSDDIKPAVSVGAVHGDDGRERVVVLTEVPEDVVSEFVLLSQISGAGALPSTSAMPDLARCDIAAFLFDSSSPDSFRSARNMMEAVSTSAGDTLPCVLLASKDDLGMAQDLEEEIKRTCADLAVPLPAPLSVVADGTEGTLRRLVSAAVRPDGNIPFTRARKAHKKLMRQLYIFGLGAAGSVLTLYLAHSLYSYLKGPSPSASSSAHNLTRAEASSSGQSQQAASSGNSIDDTQPGSWFKLMAFPAAVTEGVAAVQQGWLGAVTGQVAD